MTSEPMEPDPHEPAMAFRATRLRDMRTSEVAIRFAFGATVSIVASTIGEAVGPRAGGLLLAFPAILPATLTLLEKKEGAEAAVHDLRGAILGSVGLLGFAATVALLLTRAPAALALPVAAAVWVVLSFGLYAVVVTRRR